MIPRLLICLTLAGCAAAGARAMSAADVALYDKELDDCLVEARDAGRSLAVYDQCAREADVRHGKREAGAP